VAKRKSRPPQGPKGTRKKKKYEKEENVGAERAAVCFAIGRVPVYGENGCNCGQLARKYDLSSVFGCCQF